MVNSEDNEAVDTEVKQTIRDRRPKQGSVVKFKMKGNDVSEALKITAVGKKISKKETVAM